VLVTITKIGKKVGVHAYVHKFRHTCAIEYLRSGGNLATLKEMLGHEHIETTMKYLTALNSDDVINAHRQFSPGDRFL
ncbi:MAG: site-specific integrase, partial [Dehalococcoidia bacterium]